MAHTFLIAGLMLAPIALALPSMDMSGSGYNVNWQMSPELMNANVPTTQNSRSSIDMAVSQDPVPDIVVAVPSKRRWTRSYELAPQQYVKPLITSLQSQMSDIERQHVKFLLMNVDDQPDQHRELLELQSLPNVHIVTKDPTGQPHVTEDRTFLDNGKEVSRETFDWVAGETHDVPNLLYQASKLAPYILFLEDDVKATSNAIGKIYKFIAEMKAEGKGDFFMVDLYTPNISWGPKWAGNKERYDFECCTQAMLFNSYRVSELCEYEIAHPRLPVDDNIRDWVRENPDARRVYAMMPNPFEHVGIHSSNPENSESQIHTSLHFEP